MGVNIKITSGPAIERTGDLAAILTNLRAGDVLFIDETQDLTKDYGNAIIRIIKDKYIDADIVGDALQSISFEDNAFVYLNSI